MALAGAATVGLSAQFPVPAGPQHLIVATSVGKVAPGKAIELYADIKPQPKIHVYAPGAEDYQPIKVTISPQAGLTVQQLHYPKASLLVNEVEKVPVYDKPFRLVQDVKIAPGSQARALTVTGKIEYQACDDEVCYRPATIPVTWTIELR